MFLFTEKPRVRQKEKLTKLFELGAFIYLNVSGKKSPELSWVCVCVFVSLAGLSCLLRTSKALCPPEKY